MTTTAPVHLIASLRKEVAHRKDNMETRNSLAGPNETSQPRMITVGGFDVRVQQQEEGYHGHLEDYENQDAYEGDDSNSDDSLDFNCNLSTENVDEDRNAAFQAASLAKRRRRTGGNNQGSPYYHWEPDMSYLKDCNIDLKALENERREEMMWLRGFEGA